MTIIISNKEIIAGTVSPSSLNQPNPVVDIGVQTDDYIVEGYIDLSQMQEGDEVVIEEYLAVDGVNKRRLSKTTFTNAQSEPVVRFHSKTIRKDGYYSVTLNQTKGTLRQYPYYFVLLQFGEV